MPILNVARRWLPLLAYVIVLVIAGWLMCEGIYDLFASVPAVHVPRISVDTLGIHVGLDVPTLTSAAMAVGGLMAVVGAAWALWRWSTRSKTQRWSILLQGLGLTLAIVAMVVSILEFLATAFDGVG